MPATSRLRRREAVFGTPGFERPVIAFSGQIPRHPPPWSEVRQAGIYEDFLSRWFGKFSGGGGFGLKVRGGPIPRVGWIPAPAR
jgi:hypothetical protein